MAYSILVSAQGPLVLVLVLRGSGLRVGGQGLTIKDEERIEIYLADIDYNII